ncbi:hypothetical protein MRX96_056419 [Rhipicephalus microplus]
MTSKDSGTGHISSMRKANGGVFMTLVEQVLREASDVERRSRLLGDGEGQRWRQRCEVKLGTTWRDEVIMPHEAYEDAHTGSNELSSTCSVSLGSLCRDTSIYFTGTKTKTQRPFACG